MFKLVITSEQSESEVLGTLSGLTQQSPLPDDGNIKFSVYYLVDAWHVSHAKLTSEEGLHRKDSYDLTMSQLSTFLERYRPKMIPEEPLEQEAQKIQAEAIAHVKAGAQKAAAADAFMRDLRALLTQSIAPADLKSNPALEKWLDDLTQTLLRQMAEYDPTSKPDDIRSFAIAAIMDGTWMAQGLGTNVGLSHGGHVGALLASHTAAAGIAFAAATAIAMGVACGYVAAQIYEKRAIAKFKEKNRGEEPSAEQKKLFTADAKILGISVFANISGWTLGLAVMQIAFSVASVHPAGIVFNVVASVCAGVGQAIGAGLAFWRAEKSKCVDENGQFSEDKWTDHRKKTGFVKELLVTAAASFVSGFAWNMIGTYLPAPIQKVLQHVKEPIKQTINIIITSVVSFFATLTALSLPKLRNLFPPKSAEIHTEKRSNAEKKSEKNIPDPTPAS